MTRSALISCGPKNAPSDNTTPRVRAVGRRLAVAGNMNDAPVPFDQSLDHRPQIGFVVSGPWPADDPMDATRVDEFPPGSPRPSSPPAALPLAADRSLGCMRGRRSREYVVGRSVRDRADGAAAAPAACAAAWCGSTTAVRASTFRPIWTARAPPTGWRRCSSSSSSTVSVLLLRNGSRSTGMSSLKSVRPMRVGVGIVGGRPHEASNQPDLHGSGDVRRCARAWNSRCRRSVRRVLGLLHGGADEVVVGATVSGFLRPTHGADAFGDDRVDA